ncbi:MAG: ABC transporter permease [Chitinophagaceae bacterium]|nr:ABC transporter permease [Chitinophagaceae bacterium]
MRRSYFMVACRNLIRNRKYSLINITGLGISIASCILIGLFVFNEMSFDKQVPGKENIYRLNEYIHYDGTAPQLSAASGPPIAPFLKDNFSEIEGFTRIYPVSPNVYPAAGLEFEGKKIATANLACTDTSFAGMFGVKIIEGIKKEFLKTKNSIVLTQSLANKIFGNAPALNKTLLLRTSDTTTLSFSVANVIADLPETFHIQADALLPIPEKIGYGYEANFGVIMGPSYVRLRRDINAASLALKLTQTLHEKNKFIDVRLQKLSDVHTKSVDITNDIYNYKKIDGKYINIFLIIGLAVFTIAGINFINLTIAINSYRGKEIAMRKIIGAKRLHIIAQVITETFFSVFLALVTALILSIIFLPFLNSILDRNLSPAMLYQPVFIAVYIVAILCTTIMAGMYPAWLISSLQANEALKNKLPGGISKPILRNVLVAGQFTIAIVFVVSLLVFVKQVRYMQNKNLGYSYAQVIKIPLENQDAEKLPIIRDELLKLKGVEDVTNGYMELGGDGGIFGIDYKAPDGQDKHVSVNFENAGKNYIPFFNMKMAAGRNFTNSSNANEYLINETLGKQMGYTDPVGKQINLSGGWDKGIVVGVVKDYNYSSLHKPVEPLIIGSMDFMTVWQKQLYVKVTTQNIYRTLKGVEATFKKVTGNSEVAYEFMDEHFKEVYRSERQASVMIAIIGGLAIIIACLGLLSLVAFAVMRRTKEIGIRKVIGATVVDIAVMLSKDFLKLILIAMVVAFPVAWWAMNSWLQNFAYRTSVGSGEFIIAGVSIILIALFAISSQAIKAAVANPVKALRTE